MPFVIKDMHNISKYFNLALLHRTHDTALFAFLQTYHR